MAIATTTVTAICFGAPWSIHAQNTFTSAPPPAGVVQANPNGIFPGSLSTTYAPRPGAPAPALPYGVGEVVKMYQGGINKEIILNYIYNTALPYHLTADGIIYMQTLGIPQEITKAMMMRDGQLQQQQQANQQQYQLQQYQQQYQQQPMQMAPPPASGPMETQSPVQIVTPPTPAPAVTVIGSDYPVYNYGYPYGYAGPYCYGAPLVVGGWGWGWGWGHGGFRGGFGGGFRGGFHEGFRGGFGGGHGGHHR